MDTPKHLTEDPAKALYDNAVQNALVPPIQLWIDLGIKLYGDEHPSVRMLEEMQSTGRHVNVTPELRKALYADEPKIEDAPKQ